MSRGPFSRRHFLTLATGLAATPFAYALTPAQSEGPFYPARYPEHRDNDLSRRAPGEPRAQGQLLRVEGKVSDAGGNPVEGARIEIWQADASGHYRHPLDQKRGSSDPHFQGWGFTESDAQGRYEFLTVKPAPYPAGPDWTRPPHIHYRVSIAGTIVLTTQLYFQDETLNRKDYLLGSLKPSQQQKLITALNERDDMLQGRFNLVVARPGQAKSAALTPAS